MAFLLSCTKEIILLLELLKPGRIGELGSTLTVADRGGEPLSLLSDLGIIQGLAFDLLILCSIRQCPFDVGKFTLRLLRWTLVAIIRVQELFLLS